jgi:lysine-specific demethylase 3
MSLKEIKSIKRKSGINYKHSHKRKRQTARVSTSKCSGSFFQNRNCCDLKSNSDIWDICRECQIKQPNGFVCRFTGFRKIKYVKSGRLSIARFPNIKKDPKPDDLSLWLPSPNASILGLNTDSIQFILRKIGDEFCNFAQAEKEAARQQNPNAQQIAWKPVSNGLRENCDVCETSIFNFHWTCTKCGFIVCTDCYRENNQHRLKEDRKSLTDRDSGGWFSCSNHEPHLKKSLMPTQVIPGNALDKVLEYLHCMRDQLRISQLCCSPEVVKCVWSI